MMNRQDMLKAEWQDHSAVLLSWPHAESDWAYMLEAVTQCYIEVSRKLSKVAHLLIVAPDISLVANRLRGFVDPERVTYVEVPTDDTWARDFGMICVPTHDNKYRAIDFKFNGWGLKFRACHDNLINRGIFNAQVLADDKVTYENHLGFVLEGGSIDIDDDGTLMTTQECLLSANRNGDMTQDEIEAELKSCFGCHKVIWLEHGALAGDDTDSHIDTLARFLPGKVIAYSICDREDDEHYHELKKMEEELKAATDMYGVNYKLTPLPIPDAIYDADGCRLPATYANFLIINHTIFLPTYGDAHYDGMALERLQIAVPDHHVVGVDCRALIEQHGSLHCITMQIPSTILKSNVRH